MSDHPLEQRSEMGRGYSSLPLESTALTGVVHPLASGVELHASGAHGHRRSDMANLTKTIRSPMSKKFAQLCERPFYARHIASSPAFGFDGSPQDQPAETRCAKIAAAIANPATTPRTRYGVARCVVVTGWMVRT
jgi:hypothetical protein